MGGKSCGEVTLAYGKTKFTSLVVGVAADDDALADVVHNLLLFLWLQQTDSIEVKLVEASAPSLERLGVLSGEF